MVLLLRLAYPNWLSELAPFFGGAESEISQICINYICVWGIVCILSDPFSVFLTQLPLKEGINSLTQPLVQDRYSLTLLV